MPPRSAVSFLAALAAVTGIAAAASCFAEPAPPSSGPPPAGTLLKGKAAFGDWRANAPGVRRLITPADMPAPLATTPAASMAQVADQPADAKIQVPEGFSVASFASGMDGPRVIAVAPNGDVFVAEQPAGRVRVLRPGAGGAAPSENTVFAEGQDQPFGVAFYPLGPDPQWVYVANNNAVVRFPYKNGDLKARGPAETVIAQISPHTGGHWTRDLAFSPDGQKMYVSVGSSGNLAEGMGKKSVKDAQAWDAQQHAVGAAWDVNEDRANVLVADPDGKNLHIFATGIRNCSGLTVQPGTGDVWCSVNERDMLGDDLVPDYATSVKQGAFYGWPWYYIGDNEDPRLKGDRPDLKGKITVPDVLFQAHSAAVQVEFYNSAAPGAFPAEYQGAAFVALHGSWNRANRTGYKVVLLPMKNGKATGEYVDFMTGFVTDAKHVWARPYGLAVLKDGSLLVGDDANNTIWRVSYTGK